MKFNTGEIVTNGFYQYLILGVTTCQTRYIYKVLFVKRNMTAMVQPFKKPPQSWVLSIANDGQWDSAEGNVQQEIITCGIEAIEDMFVLYSKDTSLVPSYIGEEYPDECQICFDPDCKAPNKRSQ